MGSLVSFLSRRRREGDELQRKYKEALSPSNLPKTGGSYVILNVASQSSDNESDTLALTSLHKSGKRSVSVTKWKGSNHSDQVFKIEPCIDYGENCVVSCYGDKEPKLQWKTGDEMTTLEIEVYPVAGEERLRPPRKQWRFRFEEKSPPGTKMYRIVGMDDDLDGIDCLAVEGIGGESSSKLVFKRRKDDDLSQLWYLT